MPEIEWKDSAVADLLAIVDFISDDNRDAALALMEEVQGKVTELRAETLSPRQGRGDSRTGRAPQLHRSLRRDSRNDNCIARTSRCAAVALMENPRFGHSPPALRLVGLLI